MKWKMLKVDEDTHKLVKNMSAERGMTIFGLVRKVLFSENNIYTSGVFSSNSDGKNTFIHI